MKFNWIAWLHALEAASISDGAARFGLALWRKMNEDGLIVQRRDTAESPSVRGLAKELARPRPSVIRYLEELRTEGLLDGWQATSPGARPCTHAPLSTGGHVNVRTLSIHGHCSHELLSTSGPPTPSSHPQGQTTDRGSNGHKPPHDCTPEPLSIDGHCTNTPLSTSGPPPAPPNKEVTIEREKKDDDVIDPMDFGALADESGAAVRRDDLSKREREVLEGYGKLPRKYRIHFRGRRILERSEALPAKQMLALWQDTTGVAFGEWNPSNCPWDKFAATWLAVVRSVVTRDEWLDVCASAASQGLDDPAGLPWLTGAVNGILGTSRRRRGRTELLEEYKQQSAAFARLESTPEQRERGKAAIRQWDVWIDAEEEGGVPSTGTALNVDQIAAPDAAAVLH